MHYYSDSTVDIINGKEVKMPVYEVRYLCDDGSTEYWGEVQAVSREDACAKAFAIEPKCIDGLRMRYRAEPILTREQMDSGMFPDAE